MGLWDSLKNAFSRPSSTPAPQRENAYDKSLLINKILDLKANIQSQNSYDTSVLYINRSNLQGKSLAELQELYSTLTNKLNELKRRSQRPSEIEDYDAALWTGKPAHGMTDHDLDFAQRGDR